MENNELLKELDRRIKDKEVDFEFYYSPSDKKIGLKIFDKEKNVTITFSNSFSFEEINGFDEKYEREEVVKRINILFNLSKRIKKHD